MWWENLQTALRLTFVAVMALVASAALPAQASFVQFNSRAAFDGLGPYIAVDWGVFGPAGTLISTPDSRVVGPLTVSVASSEGVLSRHDEGVGFTGTFSPGDHLLTDAGSLSDTFLVSFAAPVAGFGTQIVIHSRTGAYTGGVELFSASNTLLYTATFSGNNTGAEDNSAPFVGVLSDLPDISYLNFFIDQPGFFPDRSGDLAINRLDVLQAVPEPSMLGLLVIVLAIAAFGYGRRSTRPM
jgi:hypothetical protein